MKYLWILMAVIAFASSATATSSFACCNGGKCCKPPHGCCAKAK